MTESILYAGTPVALSGQARQACWAYLERYCNKSGPSGNGGPLLPQALLYVDVLWQLAECLGARNILEIGIGPEQVSGCTFLHSLAQRGPGARLVSIDLDPTGPQPIHLEKAHELGVAWHFLHGDSLSPAIMEEAGRYKEFDLLYVDGDHDYAHAISDTLNYLPFVRAGGFVVVDDTAEAGVIEAAKTLRARGFHYVYLSHHPETPTGNGRIVFHKL